MLSFKVEITLKLIKKRLLTKYIGKVAEKTFYCSADMA